MASSDRDEDREAEADLHLLEGGGLRALDHTWKTWIHLTPAERLRRSHALRRRLRDPRATHDAKLFPKP